MGQGLPHPAPGMVPWRRLFELPTWTGEDRGQALAQDWYLSGLAPAESIQVPWTWITGPIRFRQDKPITHAAVSKTGGGTSVSTVDGDEQVRYTADLDVDDDVSADNLASFITTYYDEVRTRLAMIRFVLNSRSTEELWLLLGARVGTKFELTGTPSGWPTGATTLVIEGIRRSSRVDISYLEWTTSPLIGETVGAAGPFFRLGVSALGGTDLLPW